MVATALKAEILEFQQIKFNKILNKTKPKKKKSELFQWKIGHVQSLG